MRIDRFEVLAGASHGGVVDVDVDVDCSSGTYIRALARDLGAALAVGGHLTSLRRTRVGRFGLDQARSLDELAEQPAAELHARRRVPAGVSAPRPHRRGGRGDQPRPVACRRPASTASMPRTTRDGRVIALLRDEGPRTKSVVVIRPATMHPSTG